MVSQPTIGGTNVPTQKTQKTDVQAPILAHGVPFEPAQLNPRKARGHPVLKMVCFAPLKGYRSNTVSPNGGRAVVFSLSEAYTDLPITVPCGQCIGCRLEKSRQWAIRCVHEASLYDHNSFITLTYDEIHLPQRESVDLRHFQLFLKRLRKQNSHKTIRYYHCGEYGDLHGRPHYHALLFNHDFTDKQLFKEINKHKIYTSRQLQKLWPYGYSSIGEVTFQSAAYVARYILKKVSGPNSEQHYQHITSDGQIVTRNPEYCTMSRRPGIGAGWYDKYETDLYPHDVCVVDGSKKAVPKFYNNKYQLDNKNQYSKIRAARKQKARKKAGNNTPERLAVREDLQIIKQEKLQRNLT